MTLSSIALLATGVGAGKVGCEEIQRAKGMAGGE